MSPDPGTIPVREEGVVEVALPALTFRVRLKDDREVLGHLAGKLRLYHIRVLPGDRVLIELSPDGRSARLNAACIADKESRASRSVCPP